MDIFLYALDLIFQPTRCLFCAFSLVDRKSWQTIDKRLERRPAVSQRKSADISNNLSGSKAIWWTLDRDYIFLTLDHESFLIDQVDDTKKKFVAEGLCFFVMRLICNSCL